MKPEPVIAQARVELPDPQDCTDSADTLAMIGALFDPLVRRGPGGTFEPALATAWTVSDDARRWHFKLREGVRFHDGSAFDSTAMVYSLERLKRPEIGATLGSPAVWRQYLEHASFEADGEHAVKVSLPEPIADLLDILCATVALPGPEADEDGFAARPVGTGAYRLESMEPGERIVMRANAEWYGGKPANPALTWQAIPDVDERLDALLTGRVAISSKVAGAKRLGELAQANRGRQDYLDPTAIIYLFNCQKGPCADKRVRRAMQMAVDRVTLAQSALDGAAYPLEGVFSPVHWGYVASESSASVPDRSLARELLRDAGYGDGLSLVVDCPVKLPDEALALSEALVEQMAGIGIEIRLNITEDRVRYAEKVRDKSIHEMCVFDSSPLSTFRVLYEKIDSRVAGAWWQGYSNPAVEAELDAARATPAASERLGHYQRAYELLRDDPPWLTVYNHRQTLASASPLPAGSVRFDGILDAARLPAL